MSNSLTDSNCPGGESNENCLNVSKSFQEYDGIPGGSGGMAGEVHSMGPYPTHTGEFSTTMFSSIVFIILRPIYQRKG